MKNKFLILSLLVSSFFTACSSDDDGGNNTDPIVGKWTIVSETSGGVELTLTDCGKKSNFIFTSDNIVEDNYYDDFDGECYLEDTAGTWVKNSDNSYTGNFQDIEGDEVIDEYSLEFTISNNQLLWTDGDDVTIYSKIK